MSTLTDNRTIVSVSTPISTLESQIHKGKWTIAENKKFFESMLKFGTNWHMLKRQLPSRSMKQIKMHVQKFVNLMKKKYKNTKKFNLKILDNIEKIPEGFFKSFTYDDLMNISLFIEDNNSSSKNENKIFKIEKICKNISKDDDVVRAISSLKDIELVPRQLILFYLKQSLKNKKEKCEDIKKIAEVFKILKKYEIVIPQDEISLDDFPKLSDLSQKFKDQLKDCSDEERESGQETVKEENNSIGQNFDTINTNYISNKTDYSNNESKENNNINDSCISNLKGIPPVTFNPMGLSIGNFPFLTEEQKHLLRVSNVNLTNRGLYGLPNLRAFNYNTPVNFPFQIPQNYCFTPNNNNYYNN